MKSIKDNKKGFTLVETLVVILVMGLVMTAAYQFFYSSWALNTVVEKTNDYQNMLDNGMYNIRVELADAISATTFDKPSDFNEATYNFEEGYVYIIPEEFSGYTIYKKDSSGLHKSNVGILNSTVSQKLHTLSVAASTGGADAQQEFDDALKDAGYRTVIGFNTQSSGRTDVKVTVYNGNNAVDFVKSTLVLRSVVITPGTSGGDVSNSGNCMKFKTGVTVSN